MQDNLKRAFMRGVCALNFEAMNVLQGNSSQLSDQMQMNQNILEKDDVKTFLMNPLSELNLPNNS